MNDRAALVHDAAAEHWAALGGDGRVQLEHRWADLELQMAQFERETVRVRA